MVGGGEPDIQYGQDQTRGHTRMGAQGGLALPGAGTEDLGGEPHYVVAVTPLEAISAPTPSGTGSGCRTYL